MGTSSISQVIKEVKRERTVVAITKSEATLSCDIADDPHDILPNANISFVNVFSPVDLLLLNNCTTIKEHLSYY